MSQFNNYQRLNKLVTENPEDPDIWIQLGNYYLDAGEELQAQKCFLKVLEFRPMDIEAQVNLDRIYGVTQPEKPMTLRGNLKTIKWYENEIPMWLQLIISIISFVVIFLLARNEKWTAGNMVWSLWISSLTIGYGYLITGLVSEGLTKKINLENGMGNRLFQGDGNFGMKATLLIIGFLFQFAFFTVHFCLFHFIYSIFLNEFFPLLGRSFERFADFWYFISTSFLNYWPVVLFTLFASLRKFQRISTQNEFDYQKKAYANVIKIHLSIFLFAGFSFTLVEEWVLPIILFIYFFPFTTFYEFFRSKRKDLISSDVAI